MNEDSHEKLDFNWSRIDRAVGSLENLGGGGEFFFCTCFVSFTEKPGGTTLDTVFDIQMWQRQIFRKQIFISTAHTFSESEVVWYEILPLDPHFCTFR